MEQTVIDEMMYLQRLIILLIAINVFGVGGLGMVIFKQKSNIEELKKALANKRRR